VLKRIAIAAAVLIAAGIIAKVACGEERADDARSEREPEPPPAPVVAAPPVDAPPAAVAAPSPPQPPPGPARLAPLGMSIEVDPREAVVRDVSDQTGGPAVMVSSDRWAFTVRQVTGTDPLRDSYASARATIQQEASIEFKRFAREQQTPDGWVLAWDLESQRDKTPKYAVEVRKVVGGRTVTCGSTATTADARDRIARACESLAE
jgi:hypothetical protein